MQQKKEFKLQKACNFSNQSKRMLVNASQRLTVTLITSTITAQCVGMLMFADQQKGRQEHF